MIAVTILSKLNEKRGHVGVPAFRVYAIEWLVGGDFEGEDFSVYVYARVCVLQRAVVYHDFSRGNAFEAQGVGAVVAHHCVLGQFAEERLAVGGRHVHAYRVIIQTRDDHADVAVGFH